MRVTLSKAVRLPGQPLRPRGYVLEVDEARAEELDELGLVLHAQAVDPRQLLSLARIVPQRCLRSQSPMPRGLRSRILLLNGRTTPAPWGLTRRA